MDTVKAYTNAALEEIEAGRPVEGLILVIAALEELTDAVAEQQYSEHLGSLSPEAIEYLDSAH